MRELLGFYAALYGLPIGRVAQVMEQAVREYQLTDFMDRKAGVLSTGMQQRASIACAMLHEPSLLLLDEPMLGLDPDMRERFCECLTTAGSAGTAMLISIHHFVDAALLCHKIYFLHEGKMAGEIDRAHFEGSPQAVQEAYRVATGLRLAGEPGPC